MKKRLLLLCFALILMVSCTTQPQQGEAARSDAEESTEIPAETPSEAAEETEAPVPETDGAYSRVLARKNQEYDPGSAVLTNIITKQQVKKDYTVMVYMIGSNLESASAAATSDILEMEAAGLDHAKNNLILYTGGSTRWHSEIPCDRNCVVDLSLEPGDRVVASTEKNADMGAPETLRSFIDFCTTYYTADHYALIFWDHGGGPLWGYGSDELFSGDGLLLSEMDEAMRGTAFDGAGRLDFVGFDACLMGSLENMAIWSRYATYYVGSEELEPGDGWDYHFLSALNETTDTYTILDRIITSFQTYYDDKRTDQYDPDITLAAIDLSKVETLQNTLARTAKHLNELIDKGRFPELQSMRRESKSFGLTGGRDDNTSFAYDLVDLGSLADCLEDMDADHAAQIRDAIHDMVILQTSNVDEAYGVTLYYPNDNRSQYYEMQDTYAKLNLNQEYLNYLQRISRAWRETESHDWKLDPLRKTAEGYMLQLTEEQQEQTARVTYTVLEKHPQGGYIPILTNAQVEPDETGQITLDADPALISIVIGEDTALWRVKMTEANAKRRIYQTEGTRLLSGGISFYQRLTSEAVTVTVVMQEDPTTGEIRLKTVNSVSDDVTSSGKDSVDVSHYDAIFYNYLEQIPTWDPAGNLLPPSAWEEGNYTGAYMMNLDGSFGFQLTHASEQTQDLYYVVTLEDLQGTLFTTDPVAIDPERTYSIYTEETPEGRIEYQIYADHALVLSYTGSDTEIVIPEKIEGKPVTEIGPSVFGKHVIFSQADHYPVRKIVLPDSIETIGRWAFMNCTELTDIRLPKGLKRIGAGAFSNCASLTHMELPETLVEIGAYAFSCCDQLEDIALPAGIQRVGKGIIAMCPVLKEIHLPDACSTYQLNDGLLYTADGRTLLACPGARTGVIQVAAGTMTIAADAFSSGSLTEVRLPEGLKEIQNYAFFHTAQLKAPVFPKSLESIGKYAFSTDLYCNDATKAAEVSEKICIGANVRYIGQEAFVGIQSKMFEVDPANLYFASVEGALLNKAKDTLFEFQTGPLKIFIVPEGVADMDIAVLDQIYQDDIFSNNDPFQIYLPDSLIRITGHSSHIDNMVFHCAEGSYAESYADEEGISISYDRSPVTKVVEIQTEAGTMQFQLTDTHAIWVHYAGSDQTLTVPAMVEGQPVTVIGDGLRPLQEGIDQQTCKALTLPDTIEQIQNHAFQNMRIGPVELPDSVRMIGDQALANGITIMRLPAGIENIGEEAFAGYNEFPDGLLIPASIQRIAPGAFANVTVSEFYMEEVSEYCCVIDGMLFSADGRILLAAKAADAEGTVTIPPQTEIIGSYAFSGQALQTIEIPGHVTLIAQNAFAQCQGLTEVLFNEGIENIGSYAFMYTGITSITLPSTCTRVGDAAFYGCADLASLQLNEGLEEIGSYAFGATGLSSITLPDSVYIIGDHAFDVAAADGSRGESFVLSIGRSLTSLGNEAFTGFSIHAFSVAPENTAFAVIDGMLTDAAGKQLIACPSALTGTVTIPSEITGIGDYAFYGCDQIKDVILPADLEHISVVAFPDHEDPERIRIHCHKNSLAETWCMENDWPYIID